MALPLFYLLLQSSFGFQKWTQLTVLPSKATEADCEYDRSSYSNRCNLNADYYGGADRCKDIFKAMVKFTCVRDGNADVNDLMSKIDKSVEILTITIELEKDITFDFSKLPNKMDVQFAHQYYEPKSGESRLLSSMNLMHKIELGNKNNFNRVISNKIVKEGEYGSKIKGDHGGKLLNLYVESPSLEIIDNDLSIDTFAMGDMDYSQLKFKVKAKQLNVPTYYYYAESDGGNGDEGTGEEGETVDYLKNFELETLMYYDGSFYIDENIKKTVGIQSNDLSIEFGKSSYIYNSTFDGQRYSLPNDKTNSIGFITGAQKITLIGSKDSKIPDNIVFDFRFYDPMKDPMDLIDPYIQMIAEEGGGGNEEGEAKLLEEYKIVFTKAGDWTGLKKPKITIKLSNDKIKLDTTDIKNIAEINTVTGDGSNKKKGLETKYIIIIVVCVVVVVAAIVVVVVVVVLKKKKQKVNNNSASP